MTCATQGGGLRKRGILAAAVVLLLSAAASGARADADHTLRFDTVEDGAATATLVGATLIASLGTPTPTSCYVCEIPALDLYLAQVVGSTSHPETYATISDYLVMSMLVAGAGGALVETGSSAIFAQDLTIIAQATLANALLNTAVKRLAARTRPAIELHAPNVELGKGGEYESFYSGHTSTAAVLAGSVVALAYLRGYGYRHYALGAGIALSLTVGVLRMAAQRHWFTDVLTGWIVGAAFGVFMPLLLHGRVPEDEVDPDPLAEPLRMPALIMTF